MKIDYASNNVGFTGIKNIGATIFNRSKNSVSDSISFVLTDDFNGKDLTEFRKIIGNMTEKSGNYINHEYPDVVNVECIVDDKMNGAILLNGVPLRTEYKDLNMFSFIAKAMDRIQAMKKKDMVLDNDYRDFAADDVIIYNTRLSDVVDTSGPQFFHQFFEHDRVKFVSQYVTNFIEKVMYQFLDM